MSKSVSPRKAKKEGWVLKQGPPPWKNWQKRWMILSDNGLTYFKTTKKNVASLKGSIPITTVTNVELATHKRKNCFKVDTPTRIFLFCVETETELKQWMNTILEAKNEHNTLLESIQEAARVRQKKEQPSPILFVSASPNLGGGGGHKGKISVQEVFPPISQSERKYRIGGGGGGGGGGRVTGRIEKENNKERVSMPVTMVNKKRQEAKKKKQRQGQKKNINNNEGSGSGSENDSGYGTMVIANTARPGSCEFREYLLGIPPIDELKKLNLHELQEMSDRVDAAMDREIARAKRDYLLEKKAIWEQMEKKEMAQITQQYKNERAALILAIQQKEERNTFTKQKK